MKAFLLLSFCLFAYARPIAAQDAPNLDPGTKKVTTIKKWKDANGQERSVTIIKEAENNPENAQWLETDEVSTPSGHGNEQNVDIQSTEEIEIKEKGSNSGRFEWHIDALEDKMDQVWPEIENKFKDAEVHILRLNEDLQNQIHNRAFLGVVTEPSEKGARIIEIVDGSAAQAAGLRDGDILCNIEDIKVANHQDLATALRSYNPGDEVHISFIRDGKDETILVPLGENKSVIRRIEKVFRDKPEWGTTPFGPPCQPSEVKGAYLGVMMAEENDQVLITEVLPNSPAQAVGLKAGDILYQIDDKKVKTPEDVATTIGEQEAGNPVTLSIRREGKKETIRVVLASRSACCPPIDCPPGCCQPKTSSEKIRIEKRNDQPLLEDMDRSDVPSTLDIPSLKIYPNPTADHVRVTFDAENTAPLKIRLLDSQGRAVIVQSITGVDRYDENFDLQSFPAGNYTLFIEQDGKFLTKPIIRNN
ncbi:MAG: PDZ domain-containing protein [Saprospiraceae bacterium]|nr:PDZ domain-containing protein [Saprospiraceae bacterium]